MNKFDHITIDTTRLLLRPLRQTDQQAILNLRSNPLLTRYVGYNPWTDLRQAEELIAKDMAAMASGDYIRFGIERRDSGQVIGTCCLFHLDEQCRRAEIGYDLHPDMWGNGFMHESLEPLIKLGYTEMGLNRIEADVDPLNLSSVNTLLRLGFQQEGVLRERWIVNGVKSDTVYFGMLLAQWQARQ